MQQPDSDPGLNRMDSIRSSARPSGTGSGEGQMPSPSPSPCGDEITVGDRFVLKRKLGSGSFGDVYQGWDSATFSNVAVKLEHQKARYPQLRNEVRILKLIGGVRDKMAGFARLHWHGAEGEFSVMVMDFLGPSLECLFEYCNRKFTLKTTVMLGIQMMRRLEALHSVLFLHRDIKPENFALGRGKYGHHVYLIDFGLSKRYWNLKTDKHVDCQDGRPLVGTARYTSLATHLGVEPARRDDLEALGFVLLYFVKGTLPWMGIKATGRDKILKIGEKKESMTPESLTRGEHPCLRKFLKYVRTMKYDEQPDYSALKKNFLRALDDEGQQCDWVFDWMVKRKAIKDRNERRLRRKARKEAGMNFADGADSDMMSVASSDTGSIVSAVVQTPRSNRPGGREPRQKEGDEFSDSFLVHAVEAK